jgi:2-oxoglutarate dehydrogenase E1 component
MLARFPVTAEVVWVQEEPRNMGPWRFVSERIQPLLDSSKRKLRYVGRAESASPAAGSLKRHHQEQSDLIEEAFAAAPVEPKARRWAPKRKKQ